MTGLPFSPRIDFGNTVIAYGPHRLTDAGTGTWTQVGSSIIASGGYTCSDGIILDGVTDTDPVNASYIVNYLSSSTFKMPGLKYVSIRVSIGCSESFLFDIADASNGNRMITAIVNPANMLAVTMTDGQLLDAHQVDSNSWEYLFRTQDAVLPGAVYAIVFQPAQGNPTATGVGHSIGNIIFYEDLQQVLPFTYSMGMWTPQRAVQGGMAESATGIPETFVTRKDAILQIRLRFQEGGWPIVQHWIDWCFQMGSRGSFNFYPHNIAGQYYITWLVSPKMNERWSPVRLQQQDIFELPVTLRLKQRGRFFDVRMIASQAGA